MENIEKIINLFQGKLDEEAERKLFAELAYNDDLRVEYKSYSAINNSIKSNADAFVPSSELKSRIFAKAGYIIPEAPIAPIASNLSNSNFFNSKLFSSLLTGLIATIATILIMLQFLTPKNEIKYAMNPIKDNAVDSLKDIIARISSVETEPKKTITNGKPIIKYVYLSKSSEKINNNNSLKESLTTVEKQPESIASASLNSQKISYPKFNDNNLQRSFVQTPELTLIPHNNCEFKELGLSAEFKGSLAWNLPKETVLPTEFSKFNTLNLSIFYKISDNFRAGIDLKQETFYTEYQGTEADGSLYRYQQQPNFTTYSAVLRYYALSNYTLMPFIQLGLGVNQGGYVAKPSIGLEYRVSPSVSFLFDVEYNYFRFTHQNNWFTAKKAGINYGISYNL